MMGWLKYKQKCREKYGDPNRAYAKTYGDGNQIAIQFVDMGDYKGLDVWMYPHQEEHRERRGVSMEGHELKEMALAILEYLGYDVYLKEVQSSLGKANNDV